MVTLQTAFTTNSARMCKLLDDVSYLNFICRTHLSQPESLVRVRTALATVKKEQPKYYSAQIRRLSGSFVLGAVVSIQKGGRISILAVPLENKVKFRT